MSESDTPPLIRALLQPQAYDHPVDELHLLETHISWVILTGPFAYKLKKPIKLEFLDFSTLETRHFYCQEELRLNRRLAPKLYVSVVDITGSTAAPHVAGIGLPIEYAVKLREFPQESLLSNAIDRGELHCEHIDRLAAEVADFHRRIDAAEVNSPFGTPASVVQPVRENFEELLEADLDAEHVQRINALIEWSERQFVALERDFQTRKLQGSVRECHGDMHLGNMILDDGTVTIFDCIEFNDSLRWIDVMSEVAFCVMDLEDRGRQDYAHRFLNAYLQHTGDYGGLNVLRFYTVYRAMIRAKVAWIRIRQERSSGQVDSDLYDELCAYLDLAKQYTNPSPPRLMITHGVSGSGKTFGTQPLIDALGAIRIRSDIERRRMFGLDETSRTHSDVAHGLYAPAATVETYTRLATLAEQILRANYPVIVDATFLNRQERQTFHEVAKQYNVPFHILNFHASDDALRRRIAERSKGDPDASEATLEVLVYQLKCREPLDSDERRFTIDVDTEDPHHLSDLSRRIQVAQ